MARNPFLKSTSSPGCGRIILSSLPPSTPMLQELSFQYPLKLIAPSPLPVTSASPPGSSHGLDNTTLVHTVFFLTYGGGLVSGDSVSLKVNLAMDTRLVMLTQGSTKIFKASAPGALTTQNMSVRLELGAAFCYLPDPVQPFRDSAFEQSQIYEFPSAVLKGSEWGCNLCILDWVCEGRTARAESWAFRSYASRNEIWLCAGDKGSERRLLLRDNIMVESDAYASASQKMNGAGVFGTLMLCGPLFSSLSKLFLEEFKSLPRIGVKEWDGPHANGMPSAVEQWRESRLRQETEDGLLWTVASNRGFTVVKFEAREVQGGRNWLRSMLTANGTVEREFGEGAMLCLR